MIQAHSCHAATLPALVLCMTMAACGGTKMLKDPPPLQNTQSLGMASDQRVSATLDWVIVRDGPGTWARNADWDEYILSVATTSGVAVTIKSITVVDSLDTPIEPEAERKQLVKGSKRTARRYKDSGIKVKAGAGVGTMIVAGTAVAAVGAGVATATAYGAAMGGAGTAGGAMAAASGLVLIGPALVVGGVLRGMNNSAVNNEIGQRQSNLPLELSSSEPMKIVVFFPLAPSPLRAELTYADADGDHVVTIDTSESLKGLHIAGS